MTKTKETKPENPGSLKKDFQEEKIIRISSKDIPGKMFVYPGLTRIKGVSWTLSNAVCKKLKIDKRKKIQELNSGEIKKIEEFLKNPEIPSHLLNRKADPETGKNVHLTGVELDLRKDFDIKKLKKIKSYRGYRHIAGLPVRGQRTKSHFRKNRAKGSGIKKKGKKAEGMKK